jgi:hypothetical protein
MSHHDDQNEQDRIIEQLMAVAQQAETARSALDDSPLMRLAEEFFHNNWVDCRDGLLAKTTVLRLSPDSDRAPRNFHFELDRPFKRKANRDAPVELHPGPIRGLIRYRADLFLDMSMPYIAVLLDPALAVYHPNVARHRAGLVCLGSLPGPFPFPLSQLLETRIFPILTYQDRRPSHPFDLEAASYFALEATALDGLEPVAPLY